MRRKTIKKSDTPAPKKKKKIVNPRVIREYCGGTMTKSAFFWSHPSLFKAKMVILLSF